MTKADRPATPLAMALAVIMAREGWTQAELSQATGISSSELSRIIKGGHEPSVKNRNKLLELIDWHSGHLLLVREVLQRIYLHRSFRPYLHNRSREFGAALAHYQRAGLALGDRPRYIVPWAEALARFEELVPLAESVIGDYNGFEARLLPGDYEAIAKSWEWFQLTLAEYDEVFDAGRDAGRDAAGQLERDDTPEV